MEQEALLANQPDNCVGPKSDSAGKASACEGCPNQKVCSSGVLKQADPGIKSFFLINSDLIFFKVFS